MLFIMLTFLTQFKNDEMNLCSYLFVRNADRNAKENMYKKLKVIIQARQWDIQGKGFIISPGFIFCHIVHWNNNNSHIILGHDYYLNISYLKAYEIFNFSIRN